MIQLLPTLCSLTGNLGHRETSEPEHPKGSGCTRVPLTRRQPPTGPQANRSVQARGGDVRPRKAGQAHRAAHAGTRTQLQRPADPCASLPHPWREAQGQDGLALLPPVSIYPTGWQGLGQELKVSRLDAYLPDLSWPWRRGSSGAWSGSQTGRGMDGTTLAETLSLQSQRQQIQGHHEGSCGPPGASTPHLQVGPHVSGSVGSGSVCLQV